MTDGSNARDRVHIKYCQDSHCKVESDSAGDDCLNLDHLLDVVEEQALHRGAAELAELHMGTVLQHGAAVGQGIVLSIKKIDPYVRGGDGQLTRRSDGTPVPHPGN